MLTRRALLFGLLLGTGCDWFGPSAAVDPPGALRPEAAPEAPATRYPRGGGGVAEGRIGISRLRLRPGHVAPPRQPRTRAQRARVIGGVPIVDLGLTVPRVRRVLRARQVELMRCYRAAAADAVFEGEATARVLVGPSGAVQQVSLTPTLTPATLHACVRRSVEAAEFPVPAAGGLTRFRWPLTFRIAPDPPR